VKEFLVAVAAGLVAGVWVLAARWVLEHTALGQRLREAFFHRQGETLVAIFLLVTVAALALAASSVVRQEAQAGVGLAGAGDVSMDLSPSKALDTGRC